MARFTFPGNDRENPVYFIQPYTDSESRREERLLLSPHLAVSMISLGIRSDRGAKLHLKTDTLGGIRMEGVIPKDPYDVFGHITGRCHEDCSLFRDDIKFLAFCEEPDTLVCKIYRESSNPVIVTTRETLTKIYPALFGKTPDPYIRDTVRIPMEILPVNFEQLRADLLAAEFRGKVCRVLGASA